MVNAAARTRGRTCSGAAARAARPGGSRDTRQHQGSKAAAAAGAAATVRSALRAAQLGARAGASCAGSAANTLADIRVPLSVKPDRQPPALRARSAAAVVAVAPPAVQPNCGAYTTRSRSGRSRGVLYRILSVSSDGDVAESLPPVRVESSTLPRGTSRAQLRALAAPVPPARATFSALPRRTHVWPPYCVAADAALCSAMFQ